MKANRPSLLRDRTAHEESKVTFVELFFDLVFVFAVTQVSHFLLAHLSVEGALQAALLLGAVWCVWIYTTWATSWLNCDTTPVRLMLLAVMGGGLVLSTSIPEAFGSKGLVFAAAYVVMQHARNLFLLAALGGRDPASFTNYWRIEVWLVLSAVFWIWGGLAAGEQRALLWILALAAEYGSPWVQYWVPGLGRSSTADWRVSPHHFAERAGLFVIIALGESVLVTGATFGGGLPWDAPHVAAFAVAFLGSIAMWWVYFATTADEASAELQRHPDPGRLARAAYTYAHIPLVAGVIVAAAGDELLLAHPTGHLAPAALAMILGGPALFLAGSALFNRVICGEWPRSHWAGLGLLLAAVPLGDRLPPLGLAAWAVGVLVLVGVWETGNQRA